MAESPYFDRTGQPIDMISWTNLFSDEGYQRVRADDIGDVHVSTVWIGLNQAFRDGPPLIFETMIFGGTYDEDQWRYSTEDEAIASHDRLVAAIRAGNSPHV